MGSFPAFSQPLGPHGNIEEKVIDVTFRMNVKDKVQIWRVAKSMLSDHLLIMFKIGKGIISKITVHTLAASGPWTQGQIKRKLKSFCTDLNKIMTLTIPKVHFNRRHILDWWTLDLEDSNEHVKKMEKQYFNMKYLRQDLKRKILQDARYNYRTLIRQEKYISFRKLVNETNWTSAMAKLSKMLTKKNLD
jgi:hypothetical protein